VNHQYTPAPTHDRHQDWRDRARCRQPDAQPTPTWDPFFLPDNTVRGGNHRQSGRTARWFCRHCPVTAQCLDYALTTGERHGIWGGKDAEEIIRMRQQQGVATAQAEEAG